MIHLTVHLRKLHAKQEWVSSNLVKRNIVDAGRRSGKTTLASDIAVNKFCEGRRVLYGVPTMEQIDRFWFEVKLALAEPLQRGILYKNESRHVIEVPGTEQRIRAKTCWNADSLRGDYADFLILDEFQLMHEDTWKRVGAPMLLDNNGDAVFIYTNRRGSYFASQMYQTAQERDQLATAKGERPRWRTFHFTSHDNPYLSKTALEEITEDMSRVDYLLEILAQDIEDDPRALWERDWLDELRAIRAPTLTRVVVGVDPPGSAQGAECGIIVAGTAVFHGQLHAYVIGDRSIRGTPKTWGQAVLSAYNLHEADMIIGEVNFGGDMVEAVIRAAAEADSKFRYKGVRASRGKAIRADPIVAQYEKKRVHHVGTFTALEDELCTWFPGGGPSPNRLDALVWALSELLVLPNKRRRKVRGMRTG